MDFKRYPCSGKGLSFARANCKPPVGDAENGCECADCIIKEPLARSVAKLSDHYKKQKDALNRCKSNLYFTLHRMVEWGAAKRIEGPSEYGYPEGIIITADKELMKKIVAWDIDDDDNLCFFLDGDDEPHRLDNVELW